MSSSKSYIVSGLMFRSLTHFKFIFVYSVRKCSSFILQVVDRFSKHHLLKRLSFLHCIFLPPLSKIAPSFRIWNSSTGIPSPPLALFVVMLSKTHSRRCLRWGTFHFERAPVASVIRANLVSRVILIFHVNQATQLLFSTEFSYWAILILLFFISLINK